MVWLDVDNLYDMDKLEMSVMESEVFLLYYSEGYFRSKNCQRELCTAVRMKKPVIVVFEGDDEASSLRALKSECNSSCLETEFGSAVLLEHILQHDPIYWLHVGAFSASALSRIYLCFFQNLPYYEKNDHNLLLDQGISVPGDIGNYSIPSFALSEKINILVCVGNNKALDVAEEIRGIFLSDKMEIKFVSRKIADTTSISNVMENNEIKSVNSECFSEGEMEIDLIDSELIAEDDGKKLRALELSLEDEEIKSIDSGLSLSSSDTTHNDIMIGLLPASRPRSLILDLENASGTPSVPCGSNNPSHMARDINFYNPSSYNGRSVVLLYLDKDIFLEEDSVATKAVLQAAIDMKIDIILVHEQDWDKGGCPFSLFLKQTPQDLIDPPYEIFKQIAIPLYSRPEYRQVSMRQILDKILATKSSRQF